MDRERTELLQSAQGAHKAVRDGVSVLAKSGREQDPELANLVGGLFYFMRDRATTVFGLIADDRLWDAEIIMRPSMEALLKILYVCYATADERPIRINEYWGPLADLNALRQSRRARSALSIRDVKNRESTVFEALILSEEVEQRIRQESPRTERNRLSQAWSALGIIASLTSMREKWVRDPLLTFAHSYGMSSHLIHADESALGLVRDRLDRPADERETLSNGHCCRMLSDVVYSGALVGLALVDALSLDGAPLREARQKAKDFDRVAEPILKKFYESQRPFYEGVLGRRTQ